MRTRPHERTPRRRRTAAAVVLTLVALGAGNSAQPASAATAQPWRDTAQQPLQRAQRLLDALTTDQKIDFALWLQYPYPTSDAARPAFAQEFGIPDPRPRDSPNGVFFTPGVTQFPAEQTLAATFDPDLARTYGATVADELRGKGYNGWLGPGLDLARNPKWGRLAGNPGEDPLLGGKIAGAMAGGAQSRNIFTVLKHYVGNLQETGRFGSPAVLRDEGNPAYTTSVSERALHELYLEPFRRAIQDEGATTIMCSYQQIDDVPTCENEDLLAVPRTQWGFKGNIIPDFVSAYRNARTAVNAGVDVTGDPAPGVPANLTREDFTSGRISAQRLDEILLRTLYSYFASGMYDNPVTGPAKDDVSTPASVQLARTIAERGTVLLKNDRAALPLRTGASIAVIGRAGQDAVTIAGGSDYVMPNGPTTTALQALTARAGQSSPVTFSQGTVGDTPLPAVPPGVLTPSQGEGQGLFATYFPNHDWTGTPTAERVESSFDFVGNPLDPNSNPTLPSGYPSTDLGNQWSVRYTGTLTPTETGVHYFSINPQGTGRIFVDDKLVAEGITEAQTFLGGEPYVYTHGANLTAGKPVSIRVEYSVAESLFGPAFKLGWQPPSASRIAAAVATARQADTAVVFVGAGSGEGMDRTDLQLQGDQDALIEAVARVNPRTIVVLSTPGPVLMPWLNRVEGVVQAGYQGQQFGPAMARVLFGDVNPAGRLVMTYPKDETQGQATQVAQFPGIVEKVPTAVTPSGAFKYRASLSEGIHMGYRFYDKFDQDPLFPFGFGLSYTRFSYSNLRIGPVVPATGVPSQATVRIRNTGPVAGDEVVQIYAGRLPTAVDTPVKQLAGFTRVTLRPGEQRDITVPLDPQAFRHYDEAGDTWVSPTGPVTLSVGSSAREVRLSATTRLAAPRG